MEGSTAVGGNKVGEDYREYILIDDKPTVEIDYKGIHPTILSINKGKSFNGYEIETPNEDQKVKEELTKATKTSSPNRH